MKKTEYKDKKIKKIEIKKNIIPWINSQRLRLWVNVEWNIQSSWLIKTLTFNRLASVWVWNQSFTWFWFTPKDYIITAWRSWDISWTWTILQCMSYWQYNSTWLRIRPNRSSQIEITNTTLIISIDYSNKGWLTTRGTHISFDTDWITLNFSTSGEDIYFQLTCYW